MLIKLSEFNVIWAIKVLMRLAVGFCRGQGSG